ncbi:MAG: ABC transporter permease [Christensenellales bacterium]|jgi:putative aldouronate transport system permease protein
MLRLAQADFGCLQIARGVVHFRCKQLDNRTPIDGVGHVFLKKPPGGYITGKVREIMAQHSITSHKGKKRHGKAGASFDNLELFLLHLPTTIWYLAFCYLPMFGIIIAFKAYKLRPGKSFVWSLLNNSPWCGFDNFQYLFQTGDAARMFRNTIGYNLVFITLGILIPVTLALLISEMHNRRMAKVCQTSMFLPHFLSWVVVSYFVYAFLSTDKGLFNTIAVRMGWLDKQLLHNWYADTGFWRWFIVFLNVWKGVGYSMVVYLAAINGLDRELYEAAVVDGASKWEQVRFITLPLLRPIIAIMFILAVGNVFKSDIGLFYTAPRGSGLLNEVTTTIDVYVFKSLKSGGGAASVRYSAAAAFLQSTLGLVTIVAANLAVKRIDPDAGLF